MNAREMWQKAAEYRAEAVQASDEETRDRLRALAEQFERWAEELDDERVVPPSSRQLH